MNRAWIYLVTIGVIAMVLIVGWDIFATTTGIKSEFSFRINEIEDRLYGPVEAHLRSDPAFLQFQQIADQN